MLTTIISHNVPGFFFLGGGGGGGGGGGAHGLTIVEMSINVT